MLGRTNAVRVWARTRPTDLRLGFRGLAGLVGSAFQRDLRGGDLFLFVNRPRKAAKVLFWDGSGLCIYSKRLSHGCFACLWQNVGTGLPLRLNTTELNLFLEGAVKHQAPRTGSEKTTKKS